MRRQFNILFQFNILSCDIVEVVRFDQTATVLLCCVVVEVGVPLLSHAIHTLYNSSLSNMGPINENVQSQG